jgi:hypothetical protein
VEAPRLPTEGRSTDLAITDARRTRGTQPLRIQATVANLGETPSPAATLTVASRIGTGSTPVPALEPHGRRVLVVAPDAGATLRSGWHTVKLTVAPQTPVHERDGANNARSLSLIVIAGRALRIPAWLILTAMAGAAAVALGSPDRRLSRGARAGRGG